MVIKMDLYTHRRTSISNGKGFIVKTTLQYITVYLYEDACMLSFHWIYE